MTTSTSIARFPADFVGTPETDYIMFTSKRRKYEGAGSDAYEDEAQYGGVKTIILYMPQRIGEGISQQYKHTKLGPEAHSVLTGSPIPGGGSPIASYNLGDLAKRTFEIEALKMVQGAMNKLGSESLSDNAILSATSGIIYNPMLEALYEGPGFRKFNFQFMLFSKSSDDADQIFKIVRFFQQCSVPKKGPTGANGGVLGTAIGVSGAVNSAGGILKGTVKKLTTKSKGFDPSTIGGLISAGGGALGGLGAATGILFGESGRFITQPPQMEIKYKRGGAEHPYLKSPKMCVISGIDIDYTPTGNYTTMNNYGEEKKATTVATTVTLEFTEIEVIYSDHFDDDVPATT
jgi:hypothetical protein